MALVGSPPVFAMPALRPPGAAALAVYVLLGAVMGVAATGVTRAVYVIEDAFEKLPIHWMWWPALGGLAVGVTGYFAPLTMGVGYSNIEHVLTGSLAGRALLLLFALKLVSWSIALGSGTSGGTLAPLFTIGGGLGASLGALGAAALPGFGIDPKIAGLVGMAAIFAGASRALLASVVFAFETTLQPLGLLPLLGGCAAAYLVSSCSMQNTIMTEKIARRGVRVPSEYTADYLDQVLVRGVMQQPVVSLSATDSVAAVRAWLATREPGTEHHGFPVLDERGRLLGLVTRRELTAHRADDIVQLRELLQRLPAVAFETSSLREAADLMVRHGVGRLPVVSAGDALHVVGIVTHSDLLAAHAWRLRESERART
jgi:CBS domain-containing protein